MLNNLENSARQESSLSLTKGGIWFPTIRAGTGVDSFTERLAEGLKLKGIRAEIAWLPHRAEYFPWSVKIPQPPKWASVVHINSWLHQRFVPKNLPCMVTLHSCVHDPAFEPYRSRAQSAYHKYWVIHREIQALRRAQKIVAVSEYTAKSAQYAFSMKRPIQVIPNWVDTSLFSPVKQNFPHKPFRLLFVGNVSRRKGQDLLVRIMTALGPEFQLSYTGAPEDFSQEGELPRNMKSIGKVEGARAMADVYRAHDALLFPSRLEGLPLSVLEAGSSGLPVIAMNCSSLPEVVRDGETGALCPINDVNAFVQAVREIASSPACWQRMRSSARDWIEAQFSQDPAVDQYIEAYREILS